MSSSATAPLDSYFQTSSSVLLCELRKGVPVRYALFTGTVPVRYALFTGTVPVNNLFQKRIGSNIFLHQNDLGPIFFVIKKFQ